MYKTIIFEREDGFCTITLNRPHRLNALSKELLRELGQALDEIEGDEGLRAFVITGAPRLNGEPCFCAGRDLKELDAEGSKAISARGDHSISVLDSVEGMLNPDGNEAEAADLYRRIESSGKPSIAAIDGFCIGGALTLALSCDFRVVSETARISDPHLNVLGFISGGGLTARLAFSVGVSAAKYLEITCEEIDGREAWRIGLANKVCAPQELLKVAKELAAKIASRNPAAVQITKEAINAVRVMDYEACLRYSTLCHRTQVDAVGGFGGARAFSEGRKPVLDKR